MAIKITDECINCGACEPECPNTAIYEASYEWKYSDGTSLLGDIKLPSGKLANADIEQEPVSDEFYLLLQINVRNVLVFMRNLNVLQYAQ